MALVNAFGYVLLEEELYDKSYVARFTEGLEAYRQTVKDYAPEKVDHLTGIPARDVRQAMRTFAAAPSATVMWGMGVTQFGQAVDVVKGLSSPALLTGNLGRPAVGVGPVRGQNNVRGACDMGVLPNMFPGYQDVTDPAVRQKFADARVLMSINGRSRRDAHYRSAASYAGRQGQSLLHHGRRSAPDGSRSQPGAQRF